MQARVHVCQSTRMSMYTYVCLPISESSEVRSEQEPLMHKSGLIIKNVPIHNTCSVM